MRASINKSNSYAWDCENRLIKITYPGTGNYSTFAYDGFSRNVQILEYASSTLTSTKNFVWAFGNSPKEARNAAGTVVNQYCYYGQKTSGTNYLFACDHLHSVHESVTSNGAIQAELSYDPFGRSTQITAALIPDQQYANCYFHSPSGLSLTRTRQYSSGSGRFLTRDPIFESGAIGPYYYSNNDPVGEEDPSGLLSSATALQALQEGLTATETTVGLGGGPENPYADLAGLVAGLGVGLIAAIDAAMKQKQTEWQAYHQRCDETPPTGLSPCELAKWKLQRAQDCYNMRKAWMDKWNMNDPSHQGQLNQVQRAIENAKAAIRKFCGQQPPSPPCNKNSASP